MVRAEVSAVSNRRYTVAFGTRAAVTSDGEAVPVTYDEKTGLTVFEASAGKRYIMTPAE